MSLEFTGRLNVLAQWESAYWEGSCDDFVVALYVIAQATARTQRRLYQDVRYAVRRAVRVVEAPCR